MRDLTRDLPEVNLALSLHAPTQEMREAIVPAARGTPIGSLIDALDAHMMALAARQRRAGNPQGCDQDGNGAGAAEFDEAERRMAGKKKRAMVEYVMCKAIVECARNVCSTALCPTISPLRSSSRAQWRARRPPWRRRTSSANCAPVAISS